MQSIPTFKELAYLITSRFIFKAVVLRFFLLSLLVISTQANLLAQNKCYEPLRAEGLRDVDAEKFKDAINKFFAARNCPDKPKSDDLDALIKKAQEQWEDRLITALNESELARKEIELEKNKTKKQLRKATANDLAYKASIALENGERTAAFRLAEYAWQLDSNNQVANQALFDAYYYNDVPGRKNRLFWEFKIDHNDNEFSYALDRTYLDFSPDATKLLIGLNHEIQIWDVKNKLLSHSIVDNSIDPNLEAAFFSEDGNEVIYGEGPFFFSYDLRTREISTVDFKFSDTTLIAYDFSLSPDRKRIAFVVGSSGVKKIQVFDFRTKELVEDILLASNWDSRVLFSPKGTYIYEDVEPTFRGAYEYELEVFDIDRKKKLSKIIPGFQDAVSIAFSPDERFLVFIEEKEETNYVFSSRIIIWNLETNTIHKEIDSEENYLRKIFYSPDGEYFITSSGAKKLTFWETQTLNPKDSLALESHVDFACISSDGKYLATLVNNNTIQLWFLGEELSKEAFSTGEREPEKVTFGVDGEEVITVLYDSLAVQNLRDNTTNDSFSLEFSEIYTALPSSTNKSILVLGERFDGLDRITLINRDPQNVEYDIRGQKEKIIALKFIDNEEKILSQSRQVSFIHDLKSGSWNYYINHKFLYTQLGHFNPQANKFIQKNDNNSVCVKSMESMEPLFTFDDNKESFYSAAMFSNDGSHILVNGENSVVMIDAQSGKLIKKVSKSNVPNLDFFSPNGGLIYDNHAKRGWRGDPRIFNIQEDRYVYQHESEKSIPAKAYFSSNDQFFVVNELNEQAKLYDASTGQEIFLPKGEEDKPYCAGFSEDNRYLAFGGANGLVDIWELNSRKLLATIKDVDNYITAVTFSPDSKYLAFGGDDYKVKIWDISTKRVVQVLGGNMEDITAIEFSPSMAKIAAGSWDGGIRVWDLNSGNLLQKIEGLGRYSNSAKIIPNKEAFITFGDEVKLWDLKKGTWIYTFRSNIGEEFTDLEISSDGEYVFLAYDNGVVEAWSLADILKPQLVDFFGLSGIETSYITKLALSPDKKRLVAAHDEANELMVYDLEKEKVIAVLENVEDDLIDLSFTDNGKYLLTADEGSIRLWETKSFQYSFKIDKYNLSQRITSIDLFGSKLAIGIKDFDSGGLVEIWNLSTENWFSNAEQYGSLSFQEFKRYGFEDVFVNIPELLDEHLNSENSNLLTNLFFFFLDRYKTKLDVNKTEAELFLDNAIKVLIRLNKIFESPYYKNQLGRAMMAKSWLHLCNGDAANSMATMDKGFNLMDNTHVTDEFKTKLFLVALFNDRWEEKVSYLPFSASEFDETEYNEEYDYEVNMLWYYLGELFREGIWHPDILEFFEYLVKRPLTEVEKEFLSDPTAKKKN